MLVKIIQQLWQSGTLSVVNVTSHPGFVCYKKQKQNKNTLESTQIHFWTFLFLAITPAVPQLLELSTDGKNLHWPTTHVVYPQTPSLTLTQTWGSWCNPPRFGMTWCPCQFSPGQNRMPAPFFLCMMTAPPWSLWCSSGTASRDQCSELWSSNAGKAGPNKIDRKVKDGRGFCQEIWFTHKFTVRQTDIQPVLLPAIICIKRFSYITWSHVCKF